MQIKINLQIFLFIIIFILTNQIEIYLILMLFAFIHELAHLITGVLLGLKPKLLHIMPFGLTISFKTYIEEKTNRLKEILIYLAGPLANIIICIITVFLEIPMEIKQLIIYSNLLIFGFNLIPIYPLDGGRILKSIIKSNNKDITADIITNHVSRVILIIMTIASSILIVYVQNIAIAFVIIYLWIMILREEKEINIKKRISEIIEKELY